MSRKYRIGEFADRIGRSVSTVRRWEREGLITARRTASGQRYFDESDVQAALRPSAGDADRLTVVYCRVSSQVQESDLEAQVRAMETFCIARGVSVDEWIKEIGGGMDFRREKFLDLMDRISDGSVKHVLVAHQDRLARFGYEYLEHVARRHGCEVTVVNAESLSPETELAEDLLEVVHAFSRRLEGLGGYERRLEAALKGGRQ